MQEKLASFRDFFSASRTRPAGIRIDDNLLATDAPACRLSGAARTKILQTYTSDLPASIREERAARQKRPAVALDRPEDACALQGQPHAGLVGRDRRPADARLDFGDRLRRLERLTIRELSLYALYLPLVGS
jgi:hypothetical protein